MLAPWSSRVEQSAPPTNPAHILRVSGSVSSASSLALLASSRTRSGMSSAPLALRPDFHVSTPPLNMVVKSLRSSGAPPRGFSTSHVATTLRIRLCHASMRAMWVWHASHSGHVRSTRRRASLSWCRHARRARSTCQPSYVLALPVAHRPVACTPYATLPCHTSTAHAPSSLDTGGTLARHQSWRFQPRTSRRLAVPARCPLLPLRRERRA